jgi:hypothetical protein
MAITNFASACTAKLKVGEVAPSHSKTVGRADRHATIVRSRPGDCGPWLAGCKINNESLIFTSQS